MGDDQSSVTEGYAQGNEKHEQAHAHEYFGHDHGNKNEQAEGLLGGKAVTVEEPGGGGADDDGQGGRGSGDDEAVLEGAEEDFVAEKESIPFGREPGPIKVEPRVVEGINNEKDNREVEEGEDSNGPAAEEGALDGWSLGQPPAPSQRHQGGCIRHRHAHSMRTLRQAGQPKIRYGSPVSMRQARTVLRMSMAMVIGPTPPGTGVIARHFGATASKSTSPTSR